jgi:uncharacterized membrane protein
MAFFKKRKKIEKAIDWNKEIKRNRAIDTSAVQQGFNFNENIAINDDKGTSRTKWGLSYKIGELSENHIKVLLKCKEENTAEELMKILNRTNKSKFKNNILNPLIELGFFERTIPEKLKSPNQKYRSTGIFVKKIPVT